MTSSPVTITLKDVEAWLRRNNVAASALGKTLADDQSLVSRWRAKGIKGVSPEKRAALQAYLVANPDGIPGYKRGGGGRRSSRFQVDNQTADEKIHKDTTRTDTPLPALSALKNQTESEWVKTRAIRLGIPIVHVLAHCVSVGILCIKEDENEEQETHPSGG